METNFSAMEASASAIARDRVMEDLRRLAHDAEELLHVTAGDVSQKAQDARARLSTALQQARNTAAELQGRATDSARATAQRTDSCIRTHPYETIGIAFGVGLLLGVVLSRK